MIVNKLASETAPKRKKKRVQHTKYTQINGEQIRHHLSVLFFGIATCAKFWLNGGCVYRKGDIGGHQ